MGLFFFLPLFSTSAVPCTKPNTEWLTNTFLLMTNNLPPVSLFTFLFLLLLPPSFPKLHWRNNRYYRSINGKWFHYLGQLWLLGSGCSEGFKAAPVGIVLWSISNVCCGLSLDGMIHVHCIWFMLEMVGHFKNEKIYVFSRKWLKMVRTTYVTYISCPFNTLLWFLKGVP